MLHVAAPYDPARILKVGAMASTFAPWGKLAAPYDPARILKDDAAATYGVFLKAALQPPTIRRGY